MAKITKKITDKHDEIIDNGIKPGDAGYDIAEDLGQQATEAILNGKNSREWRDFMKNFASNKAQMLRLLGRDAAFNANEWSREVLAYITANPMCTTTTVTGPNKVDTVEGPNVGTLNFMKPIMVAGLEDNIDNATGPQGWFDAFVSEEEEAVNNQRNISGKF
jgi:hypothetical protein